MTLLAFLLGAAAGWAIAALCLRLIVGLVTRAV
jgi:hypothetical protein